MICGSKRGDGFKQHYDIIERVEACRKKAKEACLKGLKWLNEEYIVSLSIELYLCKFVYIESTLLICPKNAVNRVSKISSLWKNITNKFHN